jgi:hypothetical protein
MFACITVKKTARVSAERAATALFALPFADEFFVYAFFFSLR